jgi:hypothetical protein
MNEQIGHQYTRTRNGKQVIQRQSLVEDYPYSAKGQNPVTRQGYATSSKGNVEEELEEGKEYYETRPHTSTRRYNTIQDGQIIQRGKKRIIVHLEEPPIQRRSRLEEPREKSRHVKFHPLLVVGLFLTFLIGGLIGLNAFSAFWQEKQNDWTYGQNPRTYQTDANVGHGTAQNPMSHFIALNLHGSVQVIEEPGDDVSKAKSYDITVIPDNQGNPPVKVVFQDLNRDGKLDMLVEIGNPGSFVTIMLFNNGSQFVSKL